MNRERVQQLRDHIAALPDDLVYLDAFEASHECDSAACVCGWTCRLFGTEEQLKHACENAASADAFRAANRYRALGAELLDLSSPEPLPFEVESIYGQLFSPYPEPFEDEEDDDPLTHRELALARLDALLALPEGGA